MDAAWYIAREGHEIVKGRGAHRLGEAAPDIPADIPATEPSLLRLMARELCTGVRGLVSK